MISVAQAHTIIEAHIKALAPVRTTLRKASGLVLAEDIVSPISIPGFRQSAMDGFAFNYEGWKTHQHLQITGAIQAGDATAGAIAPHQCARIYTGAPLPPGADTVIQKELARVEDALLWVEKADIVQGTNVRAIGSEIGVGMPALSAGTLLTPGTLGFLASMGIAEVSVMQRPICTIIITGNELQTPGNVLDMGQVYESNSYTLVAALAENGIAEPVILYAKDDLSAVSAALEQALSTSDLVLLTGGISAGDYDFVLPATHECGVEMQFHKIKQRPGKPLYFGTKGSKVVFGLPGNPASVLTCYYEYVRRAIEGMSGYSMLPKQPLMAPLGGNYKKAAGLTHFLKAFYDQQQVHLLPAQESFRMQSFALCNCFAVIPESSTAVLEGDWVEVHLL